jgi:hypothetical protein
MQINPQRIWESGGSWELNNSLVKYKNSPAKALRKLDLLRKDSATINQQRIMVSLSLEP